MTTPHDTKPDAILALAQYAYTRLAPLYATAKETYPELQWTIQATFADEASIHSNTSHLTVYTLGTPAEFYDPSYHLTSMVAVDEYAARVADDVAKLVAA